MSAQSDEMSAQAQELSATAEVLRQLVGRVQVAEQPVAGVVELDPSNHTAARRRRAA